MKQQRPKAAAQMDPANLPAGDSVHILEKCPPWWDDYPLKNRSFYQCSLWGQYLERGKGYRTFYCYRESDGLIKGTLLAYLMPIESAMAKLFGLNKLYWHQGPLLADAADYDTASVLLAALFDAAGGPLLVSGSSPYVDQREVGELFPGLAVNFKLKIKKWATYLVDLSGGSELLWKSIKKEARKSVRRLGDLGATFKWIPAEHIDDEYVELLKLFRLSRGLPMPPFYATGELWDILGHEFLKLPAATMREKIRSAWPLICYNNTCFCFGAANDPSLQGRDRSINDLVQWEILKYGAESGLSTFDFTGVAPNPRNAKEEGIRRSKSKWGGRYLEYPTLEGGTGVAGRCLDIVLRGCRKLINHG